MPKTTPDKYKKLNLHKFNPNEKFVSFREYLVLDKQRNYFHVRYKKGEFRIINEESNVDKRNIEFICALT